MGVWMRDANVRFEECHTAWLNEQEFAELARSLKAMARERGLESDAIINELVHFGVDAAYALLCVESDALSIPAPVANRQAAGRATKQADVSLIH